MGKEKLLSVIVPVYNVEAYLPECVDALLKQSYFNTEILLIDDGSVDKSGEICDACALKDNRIKVIHKKNGGVSAARNTGLQEACGEYIAYADSDDVVGRTIYTELIDAMEQNGTDSACCSYEAFTGSGTEQGTAGCGTGVQKAAGSSRSRGQICRGTEAFKVFLRENNYAPVVWNKVFKREVLRSAEGPFLFEKNTTLGEDEKWLAEVFCGRETSACFIAKPLYYWRRRDSSATHTEKEGITKNNLDSIRVQEELLETAKVLQDAELEELLKWRLYLAVMDVVRKCYKRRDTENFRCYYQKLKQIGKVHTFGESRTEKIRRLVWSVLFRLRVL